MAGSNTEIANLSIHDSFVSSIRADGSTNGLINNVTITTDLDDSYGITAIDATNLLIVDSTISTTGVDAIGLSGYGNSTVTVDNSSIFTAGDGSHAIFGQRMTQLNVINGSSIAAGANAHALIFYGGIDGETNTLMVLDSVFNATTDGFGIRVAPVTSGNTIDATILRNTGNFLLLDNTAGGTLNIFGAAGLGDLALVKNSFDVGTSSGTITYFP
jgi:hypothetical protein